MEHRICKLNGIAIYMEDILFQDRKAESRDDLHRDQCSRSRCDDVLSELCHVRHAALYHSILTDIFFHRVLRLM